MDFVTFGTYKLLFIQFIIIFIIFRNISNNITYINKYIKHLLIIIYFMFIV